MNVRSDRGRPPGTTVGILGSLLVHGSAVALAFTQAKPVKAGPPTYAVELVAAPAPTQKQRLAREAVPTPPPEEKPAPVKPAPKPKPTEAPAPPKPPPPTETKHEARPRPAHGGAGRGRDAEHRHGRRDDQDARAAVPVSRVPAQHRHGLPQLGWETAQQSNFAEISFLILRDGSVRDIHFVTRSGSFSFDLGAQGPSRPRQLPRLGPLPDGGTPTSCPVSFYFKPASR